MNNNLKEELTLTFCPSEMISPTQENLMGYIVIYNLTEG